MFRRYALLVRVFVYASCALPLLVWLYNLLKPRERAQGPDLWLKLVGIVLLIAGAHWLLRHFLSTRYRTLLAASARQSRYLQHLPEGWVGWAILTTAAASLFLELTLIRWHGCAFELFSLYKNFSLLACFAGLGLGYTLAHAKHIPLLCCAPLLAWQTLILTVTRYGPTGWNVGLLRSTPVREQLNMAVGAAESWHEYFAVNLLLVVTFMLTALAFLPVGQLCGALMNRRPNLQAYGLNLLGSLAGVIAFFALSYLSTPPAIWFGVGLAALLVFLGFHKHALFWGTAFTLGCLVTLIWPTNFPWQKTYSPYQILEVGPGEHGFANLRAAGHFYQKVYDLSAYQQERPDDEIHRLSANYELPYRLASRIDDVAIVGSGTGNDVAAALRVGAQYVDAIEIDPLILEYGKAYHPEQPYDDPRVNAIVNDARTFLRRTTTHYDLVVFGLLDSHTLLSHGSSVRLDSFVYTVEAFREARAHLKPNGMLCVSFCVLTPEMGKKFYLMLSEAFAGTPPLCFGKPTLDGWIHFVAHNGARPVLPDNWPLRRQIADISPHFADSQLQADVSTDDWPFLYMPRRQYPLSYVVLALLIVALSLLLIVPLVGPQLRRPHGECFWLGAGFMLIETKAITELGLAFGNTWNVIGIVIIGVLCMAYAANTLVQTIRLPKPIVPYLLLAAALLFGLSIAHYGGFSSTPLGRAAAVLVVTGPLLFSGLAFSTALKNCTDVASAMAANLLGAMCGGLLEYNSLYFGFTFLYGLALVLYALAFVSGHRRSRTASMLG